jgi:hypothetical protein
LIPPIRDPVFVDAAAGVQLELDLAIAPFVRRSGRQDLDHQLGSGVKVTIIRSSGSGQATPTHPHDVRSDGVVLGKNHSGSKVCLASPRYLAPLVEQQPKVEANALMSIIWLTRHKELPVDDLIASAIVR